MHVRKHQDYLSRASYPEYAIWESYIRMSHGNTGTNPFRVSTCEGPGQRKAHRDIMKARVRDQDSARRTEIS